MSKVDTRGMSCPQPILMTKNALKKNPDEVIILVDNKTAETNVSRFLKKSKYRIEEIVNNDDEYFIRARK